MAAEVFKWMSLGVIAAMVFTVITNGDKTNQILSGFFGGYNDTLRALEGR